MPRLLVSSSLFLFFLYFPCTFLAPLFLMIWRRAFLTTFAVFWISPAKQRVFLAMDCFMLSFFIFISFVSLIIVSYFESCWFLYLVSRPAICCFFFPRSQSHSIPLILLRQRLMITNIIFEYLYQDTLVISHVIKMDPSLFSVCMSDKRAVE